MHAEGEPTNCQQQQGTKNRCSGSRHKLDMNPAATFSFLSLLFSCFSSTEFVVKKGLLVLLFCYVHRHDI